MTETQDRPKTLLRTRMRGVLATMTPEVRQKASLEACRRLVDLEAFRRADVVMLYMPLANEVDVTPLALRSFQMGKTVCVPKVDWKRSDMEAVEALAFDDHVMDVDDHGLRTPRGGTPVVPATIDLIIVPGLAFDLTGSRLGRGGGYYDRFLARLSRTAQPVGIAFECQIIDRVPADDGDLPVGMIVTEDRICRARRPR